MKMGMLWVCFTANIQHVKKSTVLAYCSSFSYHYYLYIIFSIGKLFE